MYQTAKRRFTYVSISLLIYYILTLISSICSVSNAMRYSYYFHNIYAIFDVSYLFMLISMLITFLIIQFGFRNQLSLRLHCEPKEKPSCLKILLCFLFGFGMNIIFTYIFQLFSDVLPINLSNQLFYMNRNSFSMVLCFFTIVIAAPLFEEYLFRGVVLMTLQRYGQWFAIIISSLLFALMHGSITAAVGVFFLGLVIGYLTVKSGSLFIGIFFHMANNLLAILPSFITSTLFTSIYSLILLIVMIIGGVLLVLFFTKFKRIKTSLISPYDYPIKSFFCNWASITLIVLLSFIILLSFIQSL